MGSTGSGRSGCLVPVHRDDQGCVAAAYYGVQNPRFDVSDARAAGLAPPPFAAYFPRLLAYAQAADFGRGRAPAPGQRLPSLRAPRAARSGGVDRTFVSAASGPSAPPRGAHAQATVSSRWRVAALAAFAPLRCGGGRKSRLSIPWRLISQRTCLLERPAWSAVRLMLPP